MFPTSTAIFCGVHPPSSGTKPRCPLRRCPDTSITHGMDRRRSKSIAEKQLRCGWDCWSQWAQWAQWVMVHWVFGYPKLWKDGMMMLFLTFSNHNLHGSEEIRKPSQIGMKLWKETTNQLISVKHAKKRPAMQTCTGNTEQCVNMRIMVRLTSKYSFCLNTSPLGPCHWMLCSANKIAQWAATIKAIQSMEEFASAARPANPRNRKSTTLAQQNSLTMPYITTGLTTGKVWPSQSSHSSADHRGVLPVDKSTHR